MTLVAVDTNVLAYAEGVRRADADDAKIVTARRLMETLLALGGNLVLPAQVLAELHHVLRRRARLAPAEARVRLTRYWSGADIVPTDEAVLSAGCALAERHGLQTYDAIIVAAVASAGCDALYSEDLQDGFEWGGVTVVNPFA